MGNFIWWSKITFVLSKLKNSPTSPILDFREESHCASRKQIDEKIHVDKSSKYTIKGKLTIVLGSQTMKLGKVQRRFSKSMN